jgi:hypothetical protein
MAVKDINMARSPWGGWTKFTYLICCTPGMTIIHTFPQSEAPVPEEGPRPWANINGVTYYLAGPLFPEEDP